MSPPTESDAANQVFAIPELLESILLDSSLPPHQLFALQRVNKTFAGTIQGSKKIRRRMCLEPATPKPTTSAAAAETALPAPTTSIAEANITAPSSKESKKPKSKPSPTATILNTANSAWKLLGFQAHKQGKRTLTRVKLPIVLNIYKSNTHNAIDVRLDSSTAEVLKLMNNPSNTSSWKNILIGTSAFQDGRNLEVRVFADRKQVSLLYKSDLWAADLTMGEIVDGVKHTLWLISIAESLPLRGKTDETSKGVFSGDESKDAES